MAERPTGSGALRALAFLALLAALFVVCELVTRSDEEEKPTTPSTMWPDEDKAKSPPSKDPAPAKSSSPAKPIESR